MKADSCTRCPVQRNKLLATEMGEDSAFPILHFSQTDNIQLSGSDSPTESVAMICSSLQILSGNGRPGTATSHYPLC
jgi:hypothetical protein